MESDNSLHGVAAVRSPDHQRVLVIDDDVLVARTMKRMLEGYDVTVAQSAAGAVGRISAGARFGAIVCDYRMPGMNGADFFEAISRLVPAAARRVIFVTGAPEDPVFRRFVQSAGCADLPKPFRAEDLRRVVEAAVRS